MNVFRAILWKDLLTEWRRRERVLSMLVFTLLLVVIFHFALPGGAGPANRAAAPGLLWAAILFASILGLGRSLAAELENDALSGLALAPGDRGFVLLGKAAATWLILLVVEVVLAGLFLVLFEIPIGSRAGALLAVLGLGTAGIASMGTLLASLSSRSRFGEVLLPLLLFPLLVPILIAAAEATAALLAGRPPSAGSLRLLGVIDTVYLVVSFVSFEYALED